MSRWSTGRLDPEDWEADIETRPLEIRAAQQSRHTICHRCQQPIRPERRDMHRGEPVHDHCRLFLEAGR